VDHSSTKNGGDMSEDISKNYDVVIIGCGIEGAVHSGFICASAITGKDYLQLLPPIFR